LIPKVYATLNDVTREFTVFLLHRQCIQGIGRGVETELQ